METNDPSRTRTAMVQRPLLLVAGLALVAGAACSNGGDEGERALTESVNSSQSEGEGDDPATGGEGEGEGNESDEAGSGSSAGEVLGTTRAELNAGANDQRTIPIRVDVTRLERNGDLVELALLVTNEAEAPTDGSEPPKFGVDDRFGDGQGINSRYDTSGIGLVDGERQMLYLPAYDSEGTCLCTWTGSGGSTSVAPGESLTIEATIGGVPEEVEQLDVRIPEFPTVSGVPVQ